MILVVGGTGRLGTLVVRQLADKGEKVRVLTRNADRAAHLRSVGVDTAVGDLRDRTSVREAVAGVGTVLAAAHGFVGGRGMSPATVDRDGNVHLFDAARAEGADVVLMSIVGAAADSAMELFRAKHAAEQALRASQVRSTVVRSTAFAEMWIELLRQTAARGGRPLVFGRGANPINFVSVGDVAALVGVVLADAGTRGEGFDIGGPENLTFNDLAERVQKADGRDGDPRHVPRAVMRVVAETVGRLNPQVGRQVRAGLAMDTEDLTFDSSAVHARFPQLPTTSVNDLLAVR